MQLGSTAIAVRTDEGVVMAVEKRVTSPLLVRAAPGCLLLNVVVGGWVYSLCYSCSSFSCQCRCLAFGTSMCCWRRTSTLLHRCCS